MQFYARDIMSDHPITVRPELTAEELVDLLTTNNIGGAPVVNADGILIGVVSLSDVLTNGGILDLWATGYFHTPTPLEEAVDQAGYQIEALTTGFVSDCMSPHVHTANPDTSVESLARTMFDQRIHRMIIVSPQEDRPIGVVSTFDLLKLMAAQDRRSDQQAPSRASGAAFDV